MKKQNTLYIMILGGLLVLAPTAFAADSFSLDVEAEELMADGEGSQEVVKMQKEEMKRERMQLADLQKTVRNARATAKIRKSEAKRKLMTLEREYQNLQVKKKKLNREMAKDTRSMVAMEQQLAKKMTEVDKARSMLNVAQEMASGKKGELATVRKNNIRASYEIRQTREKISQARANYARDQKKMTVEAARLGQQLKLGAAEKARLDAEIKRLKREYQRSKSRNEALGARVERQKEMIASTRESLEWARAQLQRHTYPEQKISSR